MLKPMSGCLVTGRTRLAPCGAAIGLLAASGARAQAAWTPVHEAALPPSQTLVVWYVVAAACVAVVLLWMLVRKQRTARRNRGRLVPAAAPERLTKPHLRPIVRRREWTDSGLPTEPAAWGYKLNDFANLMPDSDEALAQSIRSGLDEAQVDVDPPLESETTPARKAAHQHRPRGRRVKPVRRPTSMDPSAA